MKVVEQFELSARREPVAAAMTDVPQVAACIPGVENVVQNGDGSWSATMVSQMGPIKVRFAGLIEIDDSASPELIIARGNGRDQRTGSIVSVVMTSRLTEPVAGTTVVRLEAEVNLRGRLGQFGSGIVQAAASEVTKEFARCFQSRLTDEPPGIVTPPEHSRTGLGRLVLRGVWRWFKDRFITPVAHGYSNNREE